MGAGGVRGYHLWVRMKAEGEKCLFLADSVAFVMRKFLKERKGLGWKGEGGAGSSPVAVQAFRRWCWAGVAEGARLTIAVLRRPRPNDAPTMGKFAFEKGWYVQEWQREGVHKCSELPFWHPKGQNMVEECHMPIFLLDW